MEWTYATVTGSQHGDKKWLDKSNVKSSNEKQDTFRSGKRK